MLDFFSLIKSLIHWQSIETGFIVKIAEKFIENGLLAQVGTILKDSDDFPYWARESTHVVPPV